MRKDWRDPSDGDVSMCIKCGKLSVFVTVIGALTLRLPTDLEARTYSRNRRIIGAQKAWRDHIAGKRPN